MITQKTRKLQIDVRMAVTDVQKTYKPGTRLVCTQNGKTYQIGVKVGQSSFWMLCEGDFQKGQVSAASILTGFTKVKDQ